VKAALLLLLTAGLLIPAEQEANFTIRFEPTAVLQTGAPIPVQINVTDARQKPVEQAKVTLQIETADHQQVQVFRAPAISPGVYVAKPVFPSTGQWSIYVEARRDDRMSSRTDQYDVSK
jgi:YtkA-like protein